MASIKDAIQDTLHEQRAIAMYTIFAIPLFIFLKLLIQPDKIMYAFILLLFILFLYLGFALKCTSNVKSSCNVILPSFNIFPLILNGIRGIIVLAPLMIIAHIIKYWSIIGFAQLNLNIELLKVLSVLVSALANSIVYTGYILFAKQFRASDVYNIVTIGKYCVDILIGIFFMQIKLFFVNLILLTPVLYLVWIFFGLPHDISTFYICAVIVFNIAIMAHYMAQIGYEVIGENDEAIKISY